MKKTMMVALAMLACTACDSTKSETKTEGSGETKASTDSKADATKGEKPRVVATTTMITDVAKQLAGDDVVVEGIMKPGGDPHLHQPSTGDAKLVSKSTLVLTNGLHLEGWLDDLVRNVGGEREVVVVSDGVEPIAMKDMPGGVDPHFWFDLKSWTVATNNVAKALVKAAPDAEKDIMERAKAYTTRLETLDAWTKQNLATVPQTQRVLITSHDAFNYFGRAYSIEVVGIQGISTEQEASQRDVANTIEMVKAKKVPAIFVESSVNPALINQVAKETGVKALGPLYSDSVGMPDSGASTFVDMFAKNVEIVTKGLGGTYTPLPSK